LTLNHQKGIIEGKDGFKGAGGDNLSRGRAYVYQLVVG
jgi:hypothetical protein